MLNVFSIFPISIYNQCSMYTEHTTKEQNDVAQSAKSAHTNNKKFKPKYKTIALTGPQGSGKTTQLKLMLEKANAEFASVGDILRSVLPASEKSEHQEAKGLMYSGALIPDEITFEILKEYFAKKQANGETKDVLIFDGFPRSTKQTEHLYELSRVYHGETTSAQDSLPTIAIARFNLLHEHAMKRCLDRAGALVKAGKQARVDDNEEALAKRLSIYFASIPELNKAFEGKAHLHEFDGSPHVHEVHSDVMGRLFEEIK